MSDNNKKNSGGLQLPTSILDLSTIIMFVFILVSVALASVAKDEFQVVLDLYKARQDQLNRRGEIPQSLTLSLKPVKLKGCSFIFKSKKIGEKKLYDIDSAVTELKRIRPPELLVRVDQKVAFKYPQAIMIAADKLGIQLGFTYTEE